jgi:putative peptide zinc metalloprotease protein
MDPRAEQPTRPLRDDLRLSEAAPGPRGEPAWIIQDPVVNRFYRIGWFEFECLLRWGASPKRICETVDAETPLHPDVSQVLDFCGFLDQNQLLRPGPEGAARLAARGEGQAWLGWRWLLHHYLFFRIPLMRPQRHLERLAAALAWLFSPVTGWAVAGLGLLGLVLVAHQWDTFTADVVESFSVNGLLSFALALVLAKTLHELGHALVATRLGLRVGHMGIAFVVLWPMLYTDTGETWKLRSARQRLAVASAGIVTELGLAALATLGWALCDPGPLRNGLLYLATTSWMLSLALNASPFMRFDGYFILSDLLDFPNLHVRASAMARTAVRRGLLGLAEPWPEAFPPVQRRLLVAFAMVTWAYRVVLFLGIAVAVYFLFFKALGIVLFAVEIGWFILRPLWRELSHWWARRGEVGGRVRWRLGAGLAAVLLILAVPWRATVGAPAVARATQQMRVFAPYPALLTQVRGPGDVRAGETLATLDEPDIAARLLGNEGNIRSYEARLAGLMADPAGLAEQAATQGRLGAEQEAARAARSEVARLLLQAPFAGRWMDTDRDWAPGQWMRRQQAIGILVSPANWQVDAYVTQDDLQRISVGAEARFHPRGEPAPVAGHVIGIGHTNIPQLPHAMLAARHGGPLATAAHGERLTPTPPLFHVLVQLDAAPPSLRESPGTVQISGARRSLLVEGARRTAAVFLRESGF